MEYSNMDRIDRKILYELQLDGRISNVELALRVNLSESACLRRVKRLEDSDLIRGYVCLLDQSLAGYPDSVFVQITLESQQSNDLAAFEREVIKHPQVMECHMMSGSFDYLLHVIVADVRDYEQLHSQHLTRLPGVARVQSSFGLRTVTKRTEMPVATDVSV